MLRRPSSLPNAFIPTFLPPSFQMLPRRTRSQTTRLSSTAPVSCTPPPAPPAKRRRRSSKPPTVPLDPMALPPPLTLCTLVSRYKRFLADVTLPCGTVVTAHCANPGSMKGMSIVPGATVLISDAPPASKRKLLHTLEAVRADGAWIGAHTVRPNAVIGAWLRSHSPDAVAIFGDYSAVRAEVVYGTDGKSRVDFVLDYPGGELYYVEVKNVTMLWEDGSTRVAVFPDSVSKRGQKHLTELQAVVESGKGRACVLYFINRGDVAAFAPCTIDAKYCEVFDEATKAGVRHFPVMFELAIDEEARTGRFDFSRQIPLHGRPGPVVE